jgi:hypothetical protein
MSITEQESIHINKFNTNQSLISTGQYNVLSVNVPGGMTLRDCEVALSELNVYNSIYNVSAALGNNRLTMAYPTNNSLSRLSILQYYVFTIPDGLYQISDLNAWLQTTLIANGLYSTITSVITTFVSFVYNPIYLCVQLITSPMTGGTPATPSASTETQNCASAGAPVAFTSILSGVCPAVYFGLYQHNNLIGGFSTAAASINGLATLVGAATTTFYPTLSCGGISSTNVYTTSTVTNTVNLPFIPQDTPYNTVLVTCNLVNSRLMPQYNRVVYDFAPATVNAGTQLSYSPFPDFFPCEDGFYNTIEVRFVDENEAAVPINDPTMSVTLLIRPKPVNLIPDQSDLGTRKTEVPSSVPSSRFDEFSDQPPSKRRRS